MKLPFSVKHYSSRTHSSYITRTFTFLNWIGEFGILEDAPNPDYFTYAQEPFEKYIEVQVWSDIPVQKFLSAE